MSISGIQDLFLFGIHVNGGASLSGFGTLKILRTPASYSVDKRTIHPPDAILVYDPDFEKKFDLAVIAEKLLVPKSVFENWNTSFLRHFKDSDEYSIPCLGTFTGNEDHVHFLSSESWQDINPYRKFNSFHIESLPLDKRFLSFAVENPKELIFEGKKQKSKFSEFLLPLILTGLVTFFVVLKECTPKTEIREQKQVATSVEKSVANPIAKDTFQHNQQKNIEDPTEKTEIPNNDLSEINLSSESKKSFEEEEKRNLFPDEDKKFIKQSNRVECTYIVGAFKVQKNADNLLKKLQKQGYQTNISKNGDFYRVGIVSSCFDTTDTLGFKKILKKYPDVWLLEE